MRATTHHNAGIARKRPPVRIGLNKAWSKGAVTRLRHRSDVSSRSAASRLRASEQSARVGGEVKLARITQAMSRQQVADRAGVSWSTQVRVELGDPKLAIATICAVTEAVGLDLVLRTYPGRQPSLRDTGQLALAELLVSQAHDAWHAQLEVSVGQHGESIDIGFFGPEEIVATELERMASDFQAQYRRADEKRQRLAGQHRRPVRLVIMIEDTPRNRTALEPHLAVIRRTLPAGSREILKSIRGGEPLGRDGLLWLRRRRAPEAR